MTTILPGIFKVLRRHVGGAAGAPATLQAGQAFMNEGENGGVFYVGTGDDGQGNSTAQVVVGGPGAFKFLRSAAAAVARTLQDKASDTLHVRDFGAAIDGKTDDSAAIDAVRAACKYMGDKVYFPAGGIQRSYSNAPGINSPVHYILSGNCYGTGTVPVTGLGKGYDLVESFLDGGTKFMVRGSSTYTPVGASTTTESGAVLRVDGTHDYIGVSFTGNVTNGSPVVTNVTNVTQLVAGWGLNALPFAQGTTIVSVNTANSTITLSTNALNTSTGVAFSATAAPGVSSTLQCNTSLPAINLANFVWGNQTIMTSRAYGAGQHVASSSSVFRPSDALNDGNGPRAPLWGNYTENNDQTGQGPAVAGNQVGYELDVYSNGVDPSPGGRVVLAMNIGQSQTTIAFTASIVSGSATMSSVGNVRNLTVGQPISGPGIPAGTVINAISISQAQVALSQSATAASTGGSFTMTAPAMQCWTGVAVGAGPSSSYGRLIAANSPFYGPAGIDLTSATSVNGTPAIGLNDGLKIGFNAASTRTLAYQGGALTYSYGGSAFTFADSGTFTGSVLAATSAMSLSCASGSGVGFSLRGANAVAIDLSAGTFSTAAIRIAGGQSFSWEATSTVNTKWDGSYLRSDYGSTNLYKVDGSGNFSVGGDLKSAGGVTANYFTANSSGAAFNVFDRNGSVYGSGAYYRLAGINRFYDTVFAGDVITYDGSGTVRFAAAMVRSNKAVAAAGTTQATATALTRDVSFVTSAAAAGAGVILQSLVGLDQIVWNRSGVAIAVYPPTNAQIEASAANASVSLASGARAIFSQATATQIYQG